MDINIVFTKDLRVQVFFATEGLARDFLFEMKKKNPHLNLMFAKKKVFNIPVPAWEE